LVSGIEPLEGARNVRGQDLTVDDTALPELLGQHIGGLWLASGIKGPHQQGRTEPHVVATLQDRGPIFQMGANRLDILRDESDEEARAVLERPAMVRGRSRAHLLERSASFVGSADHSE
jgi:hypothetical protein